ncbi:MAG: DUF1731 domain-containing protein [Chloroflexi bacterium]|nr:DUF1731 domain-containing protein [Chloroflexota bacterium]
MNVLVVGGTGYLGRHLARSFLEDRHEVFILTRGAKEVAGTRLIRWDGKSIHGWGHRIEEMDLVIHLAGKSLGTWPWTRSRKQEFETSRVESGRVLMQAIQQARHRPRLFVQQSGINFYGLRGDAADESSGGPLGNGRQIFPWIHLEDWITAVRYLVANEKTQGAYNLIAPAATSNLEFNRELALALYRPFWLPTPAAILRILLGEMSLLILEGRAVNPKRLLDSGFQFHFRHVRDALINIFGN